MRGTIKFVLPTLRLRPSASPEISQRHVADAGSVALVKFDFGD